jgi:preprotein translocase subunit SecG
MSIVLGILTFILILVSLFLVLIVLMQKSKDGGMGATLGGGMAEATFGAETGNVLSRSTIYAAIIFFVLALTLYMGRIYERKHANASATNALPTIAAPAATKATTPAPATAPVSVTTGAAATPAPATTTAAPAKPAPTETAPAATVPTEPAKKP